MLGPTDFQRLATMIDPERDGLEMGEVEEVDISHLDFSYVKTCENQKELVELLSFLKSGKDGFFPDLEGKIQERLSELDPVGYPVPLTRREQYKVKNEVNEELADWVASFSNQSTVQRDRVKDLGGTKLLESSTTTGSIIPITVSTNSQKPQSLTPKSIPSIIDKELEKLDITNGTPKSTPTIINREVSAKEPENLTASQTQKFAENEKNKGNDCLRASELADALYHYNTSLNLFPTVAVYNNRALCNLKLKHYENAIKDCTTSLGMQVTFKALIRRASGYYSIGRYQDGVVDVDAALEMENGNREAEVLRKQIVEKWMDTDGTVGDTSVKKGFKIRIQEEDGVPKIQEIIEDRDEIPTKPKLKIVEVDEDDSDDDF